MAFWGIEKMARGYDYIIVGAGSAGAALAARLAEYTDAQVLLIEVGSRARHWSIDMPLGYYINYAGGPYNWAFSSTPQSEMKNRAIYQPRGRGLGGSSAINGMAFLRGHPKDFDRWAAEGAKGWSHADVLPYFKRLETNSRGQTDLRGGSGPVRTGPVHFHSPVSEAFVAAGVEAGFPFSDDFNGCEQMGFGFFDANIANGVRQSAARAYLRVRRPNLTVLTNARVTGVMIARGRATGVTVARQGALETTVCDGEVILAGGAFASPQLLMLSGIGPAGHLLRHGIRVVHDLPGVGQNLQDHLEVHVAWEGSYSESLNRFSGFWARNLAGATWLLARRGICATNGVQAGAFTLTDPAVAHPDIQYHFFPFILDGLSLPKDRGGFCICVGTLRARSRGQVTLASGDPTAAPLIDFRYLSEPQDLADMITCVHQARDVAAQNALAPFRTREEEIWRDARSYDAIAELIRQRGESAYHPCGTCKMGVDEMAVVDSECRVHGVRDLRVVDASIFPSITSGNLNAPCMMAAERAADLISGRVTAETGTAH